MTIQCCVCKKVRIGNAWQVPTEPDKSPSSTYCPACFERTARQFEVEREIYRIEAPANVARQAV